MITLTATISAILLQQSADAAFCVAKKVTISDIKEGFRSIDPAFCLGPRAPMATSGENLYITWWSNNTGNWEVFFRASTDRGNTFGDKVNLSNSTDTNSQDAEISASGDNVYVSWWEISLNGTTSESVLRVSNDNGNTFGPILVLGTNGTLTTDEPEAGTDST